ncbi:MAG: hypothetical protein WKH64_17595 [Chloroflexia bacterium]
MLGCMVVITGGLPLLSLADDELHQAARRGPRERPGGESATWG